MEKPSSESLHTVKDANENDESSRMRFRPIQMKQFPIDPEYENNSTQIRHSTFGSMIEDNGHDTSTDCFLP